MRGCAVWRYFYTLRKWQQQGPNRASVFLVRRDAGWDVGWAHGLSFSARSREHGVVS